VIYLCAGVYAEGPTDDRVLCNLLDHLLPAMAPTICKSAVEYGDARRIDEPRSLRRASREERIAAAIDRSWGECTLFVVHSDGAGAPDAALRQQIEPGLARARRAHPDLAAAACVPVREIEAWLLADAEAFCRAFEVDRAPLLPRDPESVTDPKSELAHVVRSLVTRRRAEDYYALLGVEVRPEALRRLPAFQRFEEALSEAIEVAAGIPRV
jgi:hypothetical protein